MKKPVYRYGLFQDDVMVAEVESTSKKEALRDIFHYASIYSQDGPTKIIDLTVRFGKEGR